MIFKCPNCYSQLNHKEDVELTEIRKRVYGCNECKSEFTFNELSSHYDNLQQKLMASIDYKVGNENNFELSDTDKERLNDYTPSQLVNMRLNVSNMLTESYKLYQSEDEYTNFEQGV